MTEDFKARLSRLTPQQLQLLVLELRARLDRAEASQREPLAIVGIGCRFPGARGPAAFWQLLREGRDAICQIPAGRWAVDDFFNADADRLGAMATRWGGFLDDLDQFDPEFFGITPREAFSLDPQQRLLLECTWEALENAGVAPDGLRGSRTGVFVGIATSDYFQLIADGGYDKFDAHAATGAARSVASGRLSYVLGLEGPAISLDTACSSSLMAVHLATRSLRSGECRMAIAAGVNVILWPGVSIAMSRSRMMAPDGRCKPFDARANGFVRSEGCGVIVLKRLSDALADGDRVLALIRGSAANQDGRSNGLTAPNGRAQAAVVTEALADGGVVPSAISYVEAHGAGTSLGDPIELHALGKVLSAGRDARDRVLVGSVKSNLGHLEAAAGMAGLIKTVLMLQAAEVAPSLHFEQPNPLIDWAGIPIDVAAARRPWQPLSGRRLAGVSSFGVSGSNAHVVLEEAPTPAVVERPDRPSLVFAFSGRTAPALQELATRYGTALDETPSIAAADACVTVATGRAHFEYRAAIVARDRGELRAQLQALSEERMDVPVLRGQLATDEAPRVAFLFTGQGTQYVGMGARLARTEPVFRAALERCASVLDPLLSSPLIDTIHAADASDRRIHDTPFTQPATLALQFSLAELWRSWGVVPSAVMGHSLGEYAAACVAGVMSIEDGLRLVAERARLMQSAAGAGSMLSVFAHGDVVRRYLAGVPTLAIAAFNGPDNTVISGPRPDVARIEAALVADGIEVRQLEISLSSHSAMVEPVLDAFERAASRIAFARPQLPLISNLTGGVADDSIAAAAYWRRHLREPVRFGDGIGTLVARGTRLFVEIGPHPSLISMARRYTTGQGLQWLASLRRDRDDNEQMAETLASLYVEGVAVDWKAFWSRHAGRRVALPAYPFQRQSFWIGGREPKPSTHRRFANDVVPDHAVDTRLAAADSATDMSRPESWLYELQWQDARAAAPIAVADEGWLVVGGPAGFTQAFARAATRAGVIVRTMALGDDAVEAGLSDALNTFAAPPSRIIHLQGVAPSASHACRTALALAREIATREWDARLWLVTTGATPPAGVSDVSAGALWGFGRTLANEHPEMWGAAIDLDESSDDVRADLLLNEIASGGAEQEVALVAGRRLVARLMRSGQTSEGPASLAAVTLRPDVTYVVTGALGGVGRHLVGWLVRQGARHLALLTRRVPSGSEQDGFDALRALGAEIRIVRADVAIETEVDLALRGVRQDLPSIAGVFHAAGVLDDAVIQRMDWDRFARVLAPKTGAAWNLHVHTRQDRLEHFVLFASAAGILGPVGLSNHAAANAGLDALAHLRRASGLPALSVDWGWWADTGAVQEISKSQLGKWSEGGTGSMPREDALRVLGHLMATAAPAQVVVLPVDWNVFSATPLGRSSRFAGVGPSRAATAPAPGATAGTSRELVAPAVLSTLPDDERLERIQRFLREEIAREIGTRPDRLPLDRPLNALGLDSLMAVQLRNTLQNTTHVTIPVSRFIDGPSVRQLAVEVTGRLREKPPTVSQAPAAIDVGGLSDDEVERMLLTMLETEKGRV